MLERITSESPCFHCERCRARTPFTPADLRRRLDSMHAAYLSRGVYRCVVCAGPVTRAREPAQWPPYRGPVAGQLSIFDQIQ